MSTPTPEPEESVDDYYRAMPARRLAFLEPLHRDERIVEALSTLKGAPDTWNAAEQVEVRLAALTIVEGTVAGFEHFIADAPRGEGAREKARSNWMDAQRSLAQVRKFLEVLKEMALEESALEPGNVQLDPAARGGAKIGTGKRGPRKSLLRERVTKLLLCRYPQWDGKPPFDAAGNTLELRTWLSTELRGDLTDPSPYSAKDLDPKSRGALWNIINNLRREHSTK